MIRLFLVLASLLVLTACGSGTQTTADAVATQVIVMRHAAATLTTEAEATLALMPTPTPEPTRTSTPAATATATPMPEPSDEPTATASPTVPLPPPPTDTPEPSPTPTPEPPTAQPTKRPTQVPAPPPAATVAPATSRPAASGRIVFSAGGELHIVDAGTGQDTVPPIPNMAQPDLLSDGARIIAKGVGGGVTSLWTIDAHSGGPVKQQSNYSDDFHPFWSPDGTRFVYDSLHQGLGNHTLYTQRLDTKVDEAPRFMDGVILGTSPVWMHDDWLAYTGCDYWPGSTGSNCGIYRMPSWGDRPFLIWPDSLTARATDNHGSILAFMSESSGDWEAYVMPAQGGGAQNVSNSPSSHDGLGTFSPDGSSLAFVSNRSGAWAMWVVRLDGSGLAKLFDLPAALTGNWTDEHVAWGP